MGSAAASGGQVLNRAVMRARSDPVVSVIFGSSPSERSSGPGGDAGAEGSGEQGVGDGCDRRVLGVPVDPAVLLVGGKLAQADGQQTVAVVPSDAAVVIRSGDRISISRRHESIFR
jgi:hypothetical protein